MLWLTFLLAVLLGFAALAYVLWPVMKPGPAPVIVEDDRLTDLVHRKDAVLRAIKDLEFDYQVGKLSADDYRLFDERLRRQAVGLLQQLEQVAPLSANLADELEVDIARLRKTRDRVAPAPAVPHAQQPVGAVLAAQPAVVTVAATAALPGATKYCTNCGNPLQPNHKFCANCGAAAAV